METGSPLIPFGDDEQRYFLRAEYQSLREEIIKRLETRAQLVSIALVAFATLLGIGAQFRNADIILIYPPLALFLAGAWIAEERSIRTIGGFIRENIEAHIGVITWEHFSEFYRNERKNHILAIRGIFITTEFLATAIAVVIIKPQHVLTDLMNGGSWQRLITAENLALTLAGVSFLISAFELFLRMDKLVPKSDVYLKFLGAKKNPSAS